MIGLLYESLEEAIEVEGEARVLDHVNQMRRIRVQAQARGALRAGKMTIDECRAIHKELGVTFFRHPETGEKIYS